MADEYQQLLEAAILHLEELKGRGVRFVSVSAESLAALKQTPRPVPSKPVSVAPVVQPRAPLAGQVFRSAPQSVIADGTPAEAAPKAFGALPPGERPAAGPALSPEAKAAALADLRQRALVCVKCPHLASSRKNVVFGVGDINAQLMFIGEAPGADEDQQGEPFVGRAGQLLTKIIETMGLRRESVYIANVLKCRPDTPGETSGNRKPTPEEMRTCIPYLHEQIDLIRPKVLVALGGTAAEGLLGRTVFITRMRGQWHTFRGTPLMLTYHPSYLLRRQSPIEKGQIWQDMLQVMEKLGMPISEKQRNYFRS